MIRLKKNRFRSWGDAVLLVGPQHRECLVIGVSESRCSLSHRQFWVTLALFGYELNISYRMNQ